LPVIAPLHELDKGALVDILTQPKNALLKQYQKIFDYEGVKLTFTADAIDARGLRMLLEEHMLEMMYQVPSMKGVKEVVITKEVVVGGAEPVLVYEKT